MKFILGKKIGMSQIWIADKIVPVTLIEAGPCFVTQIKDKAVQLGYEKLKEEKIKKTQRKAPYRYLRELRIKNKELRDEKKALKIGDKIDVSVFKEGNEVKISGTSKGKGFQGAVKRWGFAGFPATHGTKHGARTVGSIGSSFPQRVLKGKKMPGRMGNKRITVKNLEIAKIDKDNNLIALKGAVPGRRGTLLEIRG